MVYDSPFVDVHDLKKLSVIELKDILHKKNIDSTGIFDPSVLIRLILGGEEQAHFEPTFPESYMRLFEVEEDSSR